MGFGWGIGRLFGDLSGGKLDGPFWSPRRSFGDQKGRRLKSCGPRTAL